MPGARVRRGFWVLLAGLLAACATPVDESAAYRSYPESPAVPIAERLALERHVRGVFVRVAVANADLCGEDIMPEFGMRFVSIESVEPAARPEALASGLLGDEPRLLFAGAGLPAARAGVRVGDRLVAIEGFEIGPKEPARGQFAGTVERAIRERGTVAFMLERAGAPYLVELKPTVSCAVNVFLDTLPLPNAFTNGEDILILAGLLVVAQSERDLAAVIGHELAHVLEDRTRGRRARQADPLAAEIEADRLGLFLAARAGYDVTGAHAIFERIARYFPGLAVSGRTHPASSERIAAMQRTEREIAERRRTGQALWPYAEPES